jgi:CheY-like chemotaxis protein
MNPALNCLIVDDDPEWLLLVQRTLRKSTVALELFPFTRGLDALEHLHQHHVDVIITDLNMPELHGFLLIEAVRQVEAHLPIIMISVDGSVAAEALASGANVFVAKSAMNSELVPALARVTAEVPTAAV